MIETKIASRYSRALFETAREEGIIEKVYLDVEFILSTINSSRDLLDVFKSPIIKAEMKIAVIKEIFFNKIHQTTYDFLALVARKDRDRALKEILLKFIETYKKHHNILPVTIKTASKLSEDIKRNILNYLEATTHKKIELKELIDDKIIGGFIINYEDKLLDTSIKKTLHKLSKEFSIK